MRKRRAPWTSAPSSHHGSFTTVHTVAQDTRPKAASRCRAAAGGGPEFNTKALTALAEAWRPWRAYAVMHLWRSSSDRATKPPV